jgi:hypothetical protein
VLTDSGRLTVIDDDGSKTKADTIDGEACITLTITLILVDTSEGEDRLTDSLSTTKGKRSSTAQTGSIGSSYRGAKYTFR